MGKVETEYEKKHKRNVRKIEKMVEEIYRQAIEEAARLGASAEGFDPSKPFSFDDFPLAKKRLEKLLKKFNDELNACVVKGVRSEWELANEKNDELARAVFGDNVGKLTSEQYKRYFSNNAAALEAFLARKANGLNLSDRVWKYSGEFKEEIEMSLDLGIRDGLSAVEMARDLKRYLQQPDMLFRRVRDEHGILHLSKRASLYHPGQGVYRSSFQNARRLAVTETNIAYRSADHERHKQLDFIVGIEVHLSGNHTIKGRDGKYHEFADICDQLAGKYPKEFKFTGWHPNCRCYMTTILKTPEEMAENGKRVLNGEEPLKGSVNEVKDVPQGFKQWVTDNQDRINRAKQLPYFLRDNGKLTDGKFVLDAFNKQNVGTRIVARSGTPKSLSLKQS